ncbi:MAG: hypothetical protein RL541_865 [Pseudomonadota bacterium]|jgi:hypothetical protein
MTDPVSNNKSTPIGLTVYDLPSPIDAAITDEAMTRSGRIRLLLVLFVCALPVIFSYLTYYIIRPQSSTAYGELIDPPRDLPDIAITNLENQTSNLQDLRGQWLLVTVAGGDCNLDCENLLYVQRQLHKSLGKEQTKLERVWLVTDAAPVAPKLIEALNGANVFRISADNLGNWLSPAPGRSLSEHLYLIDPMGRWMMRFPPHPDASSAAKIKRDMERLIRAASSWDQPGR